MSVNLSLENIVPEARIKQPQYRLFGSLKGVATYLVGLILYAAAFIILIFDTARGNLEPWQIRLFYPTIFVMLAIFHIPMILRACKIHIPYFIDFYIAFATLGHLAGHLLGFYNQGWHWDKILHTAAGAFFTLIGFSLVPLFAKNNDCIKKKQISIAFVIIFAIGFSLAVAVLWEIAEFSMDSLTGHNSQRWQDAASTAYFQGSGLIDTMMDLVVHLMGTIPAAIAGGVYLAKKPSDMSMFMHKNKMKIVEE